MGIDKVSIYPAIGVARVGNSPDEFFVGPERPWETPDPPGGFKDDQCRVKRQAARFRLFATYDDGHEEEITSDDVDSIEWEVELANTKATAYPNKRNNLDAWPNIDDDSASIHPPSETVSGTNQRAVFADDTIELPGAESPDQDDSDTATVGLGEIRTDSQGRLLVLGGRGESGSPEDTDIDDYWHNTGWYDDVSDGPVTATVNTSDGTFQATPAWIVVGPPKFAPGIDNMVTLYERLFDVMVEAGYATAPNKPSYTDHIAPVLQRAREVDSVTTMGPTTHSWQHPVGEDNRSVREAIFSRLRKPDHPVFHPPDIRVSPGTKVTFDWSTDGHNIVVEDQPTGANWSGHQQVENQGHSFSHTFETEGVYKYYSEPAVGLWGTKGAIVVGSEDPGDYGGWFTDQARGSETENFNSLRPPYDTSYILVGNEYSDRDKSEMPRVARANTDGHLPKTLYELLWHWMDDNYSQDWNSNWDDAPEPPNAVTPEGLDRAALENCVGGPLDPGVEVGGLYDQYPILDPTNYVGAFRLDHGTVEPGDMTKKLAVPWQADFYGCRYEDSSKKMNPWWPATHPLEVTPQSGANPVNWDRDIKRSSGSSGSNMVDDWHRLGFVVEQDGDYVEVGHCLEEVPSIRLLTPTIDFGDVPHGPLGPRTVKRAIVFEVNSPKNDVTLDITSGPTEQDTITTPKHSETVSSTGKNEVVTVRFPVAYETNLGDNDIPATIDVEASGTNATGSWTIDVTASTTQPETTAVSLVLDRSGSMDEDSGGVKKIESLKAATKTFVSTMVSGYGVSLVAYNQTAESVQGVKEIGMNDNARDTKDTIDNTPKLDPDGTTSIGDGIRVGRSTLDPNNTSKEYDHESLVVLTDGKENTAPYIADVAGDVDEYTYAVGLGKASNTSAPALQNLSGNHGGYLLVTGDVDQDDEFVLEKYFLQILSGITNAEVALDPEGTLRKGDEHRIPFQVTDVDQGLDVILLSPYPEAVDFRLETPVGNVIEPWRADADPAMRWVLSDRVTYYRISLPVEVLEGRTERYGQWHALVSLGGPEMEPDPEGAEKLDRMIGRRDDETHSAPALSSGQRDPILSSAYEEYDHMHSVAQPHRAAMPAASEEGELPYSLLVHSYSDLAMDASLDQAGFDPGDDLHLTASVTEAETPVTDASVWAEVERPDGTEGRVEFDSGDGRYRATVPTSVPGTYRMRVRARGRTSGGVPFQRERRVTGTVWHGGNRDAETSASGGGPAARERERRRRLCETVECLLAENGPLGEEFEALLEEAGIELEAVRECLASYCRDLGPAGLEETGGDATSPPRRSIERGILDGLEDQIREIVERMDVDL